MIFVFYNDDAFSLLGHHYPLLSYIDCSHNGSLPQMRIVQRMDRTLPLHDIRKELYVYLFKPAVLCKYLRYEIPESPVIYRPDRSKTMRKNAIVP